MLRRFLIISIFLPAITFAEVRAQVTVRPDRGVAGHYGTWEVAYRVGADGIAEGGGIRVQLPDAWHAGDRNSANPLQASRPSADHYVQARTSRPEVRVGTTVEHETDARLVKGERPGLDGRLERYVFVVRATVADGRLREGDSITVTYGDTSDGSRGMLAGIISTPPLPVLVAVDRDGSGSFDLLDDRPEIRIVPGEAFRLLASSPSTQVAGRTSELRVSFVDRHWNPVPQAGGELRIDVVTGAADVPARVETEAAQGHVTVPFTPLEEGILRFAVSANGRLLETDANPMRVHADEPEWKLYWGDLHSHSAYSWDGVGRDNFDYARNVSALDFYALTDHSREPRPPHEGAPMHTRGLGSHAWDEYASRVEAHNEPGRFVTLQAYEASFGSPWGHHNVYFRGRPGPLLYPEQVSLPELWNALVAGEALTIPHHTGKFPAPLLWEPHDSDLRRNFEIYSAHGLSEVFDPGHPLAFEQSAFTSPSESVEGPQFAQDAWARGLVLSTIAASDDHRAQPGKPHWGLAAVRAEGLTREDVFDALYARRTYGTTGVRMLLHFAVEDVAMGEEGTVDTAPRLELEAHAAGRIAWAEILRFDEQTNAFRVIYRIEPSSMDLVWSAVDEGLRGRGIYYARVRQEDEIGGRAAMAWSSPVWVARDR